MTHPAATRTGARLLREHGLSVDEIADRLGISRHTIVRWVRGVVRRGECKLCGEPFKTTNDRKQFCDRSCAYLYRRGHRRPRVLHCVLCGDELPTNRTRYCGEECQFLYRQGHREVPPPRPCRLCGGPIPYWRKGHFCCPEHKRVGYYALGPASPGAYADRPHLQAKRTAA